MRFGEIGLSLAVFFLVLVLDQLSKSFAQKMGLSIVENRGIAFGLFPSIDWLFILIFSGCLAFFWLIRINKSLSGSALLGLGLVGGGSLSNVLDRLINGNVSDFIWIGFGLRLNLADVAIVGGLTLLTLPSLFRQDQHKKQ